MCHRFHISSRFDHHTCHSSLSISSMFIEITPFIRQDHYCVDKPMPVTANVTTLAFNTALSRPPAHTQVAPPPDATLSASSVTMETPLREGRLRKDLQEHPLISNVELDLSDNNTLASAGHLHTSGLDTMAWLHLPTPRGREETATHLGTSPEAAVFSSAFLESPEFQLNWD